MIVNELSSYSVHAESKIVKAVLIMLHKAMFIYDINMGTEKYSCDGTLH